MRNLINNIAIVLKNYPAILLLAFFYFFILPSCINNSAAWQNDEQFNLRSDILHATGPNFALDDLKLGFNLPLFEYAARPTRPLSSYFEIIDSKFRYWLWHFILPHPSFSLDWLFVLILAPACLFLLLKNLDVGTNTALALVSFYLANPGVLSTLSMSGRPGKAMTNVAVIFCLYLSSLLYKRNYVAKKSNDIPAKEWYLLMVAIFLSFFWDETANLIFPAVILLFPRILRWDKKIIIFAIMLALFTWGFNLNHFSAIFGLPHIFKFKASCVLYVLSIIFFPIFFKWDRKLLVFVLMPVVVYLCYNVIIPGIMYYLGFPFSPFDSYTGANTILHQVHFENWNLVFPILKSLILETVGLFPLSPHVTIISRVIYLLAVFAIAIMFFYLIRSPKKYYLTLLMVGIAAGLHILLWAQQGANPGVFYYGNFFSVFFTIYVARVLQGSSISRYVLAVCMFFVMLNAQQCFLFTNTIYKKWYYYQEEYSRNNIFHATNYNFNYHDRNVWLDPHFPPVFTGVQLHQSIEGYWSKVRSGESTEQLKLPKELVWLRYELEPEKYAWPHQQGMGSAGMKYGYYEPPISFYKSFRGDWLNGSGIKR